jgi:hypothetical protein
MTSIQGLIDQHEHLDALAARLEACVAGPSSAAGEAVMLKMLLSVDLAEHLAGEDEGLYAPLLASGDTIAIGPISRMRDELAALRVDWAAYLHEWSDDAVEQDWDGFADETHTMMARLRARIQRENEHLIPLALQRSALPFRAAA